MMEKVNENKRKSGATRIKEKNKKKLLLVATNSCQKLTKCLRSSKLAPIIK